MAVRAFDVRFRGQSGHPLGLDECLLMTQRGLPLRKLTPEPHSAGRKRVM